MNKLKRILSILLACLLACSIFSACASANKEIIDGIYAYLLGERTMQEWIDEDLSTAAGSAADAYIININRWGQALDMSRYAKTAANCLKNGNISNPVSRMRCALALISCGRIKDIPDGFADECIGKLGVMSYVYGLHLLNNGLESELWTHESIIEKLVALQKADGGWAAVGNFGDIDVSAMCLQALACCLDVPGAQELVDEALVFFSERQLDSAGFSSMGNENCESAAQVIIALASLDIDPQYDERFIKNGENPVSAMLKYRLVSGGFAHLPGEAENEMACLQALQALTAMDHLGEKYFLLPDNAASAASPALLPGWKMYAMIAVAAFLLGGCIFALTRKHGRAKQLIFVLLISAIAVVLILTINIESTDAYYSDEKNTAANGMVYLSIRCDAVAGHASDGSTPEDGVILARTAMPFEEGDTVFDILTDAARKFKIHMEHQGGDGDMAYVNGINYLYEYAYGDLSGWLYDVNGERYSVGCGAYALSDDDEVLWQYTLELGEDLK